MQEKIVCPLNPAVAPEEPVRLQEQSIPVQLTQVEYEALQTAADRANRPLSDFCRDLLRAALQDLELPPLNIDYGKLEREFWDRERLEDRLNLERAGLAKATDRLAYQDCIRLRNLQMNGLCAAFFDTWKAGGIYAVKKAVEKRSPDALNLPASS